MMTITLTESGKATQEFVLMAPQLLINFLSTQGIDSTSASVSINGRPLSDTQVNSYFLNDEDAVFVSRTTKLGA